MEENKQNIKGDNNSQFGHVENYNAYNRIVNQEEEDIGIIDGIFAYISENINKEKTNNKGKPEKLIATDKKISRNFKTAREKETVKQYLLYAFTKTELIEKKFSDIDPESQYDLHSYIYTVYQDNKNNGMSNIENLNALFIHFTPISKKKNPHYVNCAKAIVLFFFGDCTIFEKTKEEKETSQGKLFD